MSDEGTYLKGHLTVAQQAKQLIERGLQAEQEELIKRLSAVSYYRLSGYLYPFRELPGDQFKPGTSLAIVWERYCFDRRLRVLFLDAIERIEVAVRTQLVYHFSAMHAAFGHCDEKNLPNLDIAEYIDWRSNLLTETKRSKEPFKQHFFKKYTTEKNLPVWMVSELMSMGSLLTFLKGSSSHVQAKVGASFGLPNELLLSWLRSLYSARNICAHHCRLWNRTLGYPPSLPSKNKYPNWHLKTDEGKYLLNHSRCGIILMICRTMLRDIAPSSQWHWRIEELFSQYPNLPLQDMGLPADWQNHPLWKS
jgi:abortive infection bacteriophage resistance protein